jgi:two-component system copper resistance phosphate regulon response regulator CusR
MLEAEITVGKAPPNIRLQRTRQLLVVDDSESIQNLLSRALAFMGYDVTLAGNGLEAASLFLTGSYDLVMTDFQMPLMNGWELSRIVKEQSPSTPVIVITGLCDDKLWEKLNTNCVDAIILKPFKLEEIGQTVRRLLNSRT